MCLYAIEGRGPASPQILQSSITIFLQVSICL